MTTRTAPLSTPRVPTGDEGHQRILVLGGGFAGVSTAQELAREMRRRRKRGGGPLYDIVLVDRDNYSVFQPLLADLLSGTIESTHTVVPLRRLVPDVEVDIGIVQAIDPVARRVRATRPFDGQPFELEYDACVIALGSVTNFATVPGMVEHGFGIRSLGDALFLRNRALDVLEAAVVEQDPAEKQRLLTFVVVGGGTTGTEVTAELERLLRVAARTFDASEGIRPRVVLVHSRDLLLDTMGKGLGTYASKQLRKRGVELILGKRLARVEPDRVVLDDGTQIETRTVVSTVGNAPHPVLATLDAAKDARGWITPDATFAVPGLDHVWAVGDCASIVDPVTRQPMPATAQHAIREGPACARNVLAVLDGKPPEPFHYGDLGMLVSLGGHDGVGKLMGISVRGFVAWFLWRSYYLLRLPSIDRRVRVAIDWTLQTILPPDVVEVHMRRTRQRPTAAPGETGAGVADEHPSEPIVADEISI